MKQHILFALLCCLFLGNSNAQDLKEFSPLVGKVWKAEGKWGDGSTFKQEVVFNYSLDSTLVIAKSKGFTNTEQSVYGDRNHGIRRYNHETKTIEFFEFDVFGGLTKGTVQIADGNFMYQYQYGESVVTDMWEYIDENTYIFTVGSYDEGSWKQVYLKTTFYGTPISKE